MDENNTQPNDKDIKVLRTYTSDMAEAIRENEVSVIKIAMAEKEKREQEELFKKAEGSSFSKVLLILGGIIFIILAIFGSRYLLQKKKEKEIPQNNINNIETFISYDSKSYIDTTNINKESFIAITKREQQTNPTLIKALFPTRSIGEVQTMLTTSEFLSLIRSTAPGALTRSLSDIYLMGKYANPNATNTKDRSATFLIFQTTDYNLSYASMLDWEKTMLSDLYEVFDMNVANISGLFEKNWDDVIINNKDARVLYGNNGEGVLYYVFVNKNNFVITDNTAALKEIIDRLLIKNAKPL